MIVIKIGGNMVSKLTEPFFAQIKQLQAQGEAVLIVHGGGNLITTCGQFIGQATHKINGIRITNPQMMGVTDNVLTHIVQPELHRQFTAHSINSAMLNLDNYPLLTGDYIDQSTYGEVGTINTVATNYIDVVTNQAVGLCAPIAWGPAGQKLNVNADVAAEAIASALHADQLILLTDVPGVMLNDQILKQLTHQQAAELVANQQLVNGMVPKVNAAFQALDNGIPNVSITNNLTHVGTAIVH